MKNKLFDHGVVQTLLVVVYKVRLNSSPTIQSIVDFIKCAEMQTSSGLSLFIWDNSPKSSVIDVEVLQAQVPYLHIEYVHTPGNLGLSEIYNKVASKLSEDEYLTLLDQDSTLPLEYFYELNEAQVKGHTLILPQVKCNGKLVSPGTRFFCKGKLIKNIKLGAVPSKNLLAINSGMSATGKVFKMIHYDERLMFYGTDTYFMKHYEKHFRYAYVLNAELEHSLAEQDSATSLEDRERIKKARHDAWEIVFSENLLERLFLWGYQRVLRLRSWLG